MVRLVENEQVTNLKNKYLWTADAKSASDYDSILIFKFKTSKSQMMVMECKDKKQISKRGFRNGIARII